MAFMRGCFLLIHGYLNIISTQLELLLSEITYNDYKITQS